MRVIATMEPISARDKQWIWHPYTQHKTAPEPIAIRAGRGALLFDENGRSYIDAISSWWVTIHGHAHPHIAAKIYAQAATLEQVIFTGFTHEPAVNLAGRLLPLLPGPFAKVFYSDNGSTAVEVAIKMAIQYWANQQPDTKRKKILALADAYHGDTFGAMSVSARGPFTAAFSGYMFEVEIIDRPSAENIGQLIARIGREGEEIAGFIYEPLLQGAGGMKMYEPAWLDQLLQAAKKAGIICIADEVLTGFGRTGKWFAGDYLSTQADIICLSKGLTGGTMALGITATTQSVFDAFCDEDRTKTLFHGHSFTANPIACAAALASLDLLEDPACLQSIWRIEKAHGFFRGEMGSRARNIHSLRQLGTILAFELSQGKDGYLNTLGPTVTQRAIKNGIYLRPLGNTVYVMPPYCITDEQLGQVYRFLEELTTR